MTRVDTLRYQFSALEGPQMARFRAPRCTVRAMADLHTLTAEAARTVLAENGASAPDRDTDTLAGLIATAVIQAAKEHAAGQVDPAAELANAPVPALDSDETPE